MTTNPQPFDLTSPDDCQRLLRETVGYAKVSLYHGTDIPGRRLAADALAQAYREGYRLVPPDLNRGK